MSAVVIAVLWFAHVPKLGPMAYQGQHGWHETISDGKFSSQRSNIHEALGVCRSHEWKGYIRWQSSIGKEMDSCEFMRLVVQP